LHISPILVRALRSSLIDVMRSDYVTTGVAMGLRPITLFVSYLLRNSLTPFISVLGLNIGWLIGGTIIIEQVFGVPGVGSLLITSILTRDYSIIQFVALVLAVLVILVNLLTDLAYAALDPRVSFRA
jgi:peptide/nickel transport system permease protein